MRNWLDMLACALCCGAILASLVFARRYTGVAAPLSLAGSITYLWATRWRHRGDG